jgi:hypothetical protein
LALNAHLAFVDNILAAVIAYNTPSVLADDRRERNGQYDLLREQEFIRRHHLVRGKLRVPAIGRIGRVEIGARTRLRRGSHADRAFVFRIHERRGGLAIIYHMHCAMPHRATGRDGDAINQTAIRLDKCE